VRVLEVLPTYPGEPYDGSAVYQRRLNRALMARGVEIEVLTTRAAQLRHEGEFSIEWPDDLPARGSYDAVPIRRYHAINMKRVGRIASRAIVRRWTREDMRGGSVHPGSAGFVDSAARRAKARPRRFDLLADIGRGPIAPRLIARLIRQASSYDIVLVGHSPMSLARQVLAATARSGTPVVLLPFIHENDRFHYFNSLFRGYEQAAAVLTLSPHTSDFLREHAPLAKPVALGAGFTEASGDAASAAEFRVKHGLGDKQIFLLVGRKEPSKQYDLAVEAVEQLPGDAVLVMIGRDVDQKAIASTRVRQLGTLSDADLAAAYEACAVFVLPSAYESFGMVFLDAWLRGKPVIGNRSCGASAALIADGVDGFLCSDADEIARVAKRLIEDPNLAARVGRAGRSKALTEYTWERVADRALVAFNEVLASRPPSAVSPMLDALRSCQSARSSS
jgi:glycosyltransferase involved in cell wall biosynthesis